MSFHRYGTGVPVLTISASYPARAWWGSHGCTSPSSPVGRESGPGPQAWLNSVGCSKRASTPQIPCRVKVCVHTQGSWCAPMFTGCMCAVCAQVCLQGDVFSQPDFFFSKEIPRIYFPFYVFVLGRRERQNYNFKRSYFLLMTRGIEINNSWFKRQISVVSVYFFSHEINGDDSQIREKYNRFSNQV